MESQNLHKQLEHIFSNFYEADTVRRVDSLEPYGPFPRGWAWEADSDGILLWCSSEVFDLLGFSATELIGRSLLAFAHTPKSAEELQIALATRKPIQNLRIQGINREGESLSLLINALVRNVGDPPQPRYRGVTQILMTSAVEEIEFEIANQLSERDVDLAALRSPAWGSAHGYELETDRVRMIPAIAKEEIPRSPQLREHILRVPIIGQEGTAIGVFEFERSIEEDPWTQHHQELVTEVSIQLALALYDARSYELTQQALDEMQKADRLKSQFLANMSHELRTPLNSIIGFSRVILKGIDGPITKTQEHDLNSIYSAGHHLLGLINNILEYSKIDSGRMKLTFKEFDLAELIRDVMATAVELVKDKPVRLLIRLQQKLPRITADNMRTRQILLNLVSNAAKFTERGEIRLTAMVQKYHDRNEMLISVYDTGQGIAKDDQEKIFEPFSQVDPSLSNNSGGTGLGLSICRHLVQLQGGRIWVESSPGKGSTFFFTIPMQEEGVEGAAHPKLLSISSRADVIRVQNEIFSAVGFEFHSATDEAAISRALEASQPNVILVDLTPTDGLGWKLISKLKDNETTRAIPVSAFSLSDDSRSAYDLGVGAFITEPVAVESLRASIKFLIDDQDDKLDVLIIAETMQQIEGISQHISAILPSEIRTATSGFEGLVAARQKTPDLIIITIFMPKADGFRMMEALRVDERTKEVPILLILPNLLSDVHLRQLNLWTHHSREKAAISPELYAQVLRTRSGRLARFPSN